MHAKTLMCAAMGAVVALAAPAPSRAQNIPSAAPQAEKKPAATGVKSFETGAKSFESGKYGPAIQSLSSALTLGGLSSQQMAKALYYRGVAYRKTGKAAQAISDLTSAVWLKNGLSDADRAAAMDQRQGAYAEAGLGSATPIGAPPLDAPPASAEVAPSASVATVAPNTFTPPAPAAAAGTDSATSSWTATSAKNAAEASVPNLSTPAAGYATLSSPDAPSLSALPQGDISAAPVSSPMAGVGDALSNAGSSVSGFFGNMFGGNSDSATTEPSADVATAAVGAAAPTSASATPAAPASGWQATTTSAGAATGLPPAPAPAKPAARTQIATAEKNRGKSAGKYRLQVSIVRSREEAESITAALRAQHAAEIGVATAAIDEVTFGNNTFYRVQVGPYASAAEPGQFCTALKPKGYDCLVVTK